MKTTILLSLSLLFFTACTNTMQNETSSKEHKPSTLTYKCQSGESISASYPSSEQAIIQYKNNTYKMKIAISASGSRYVGKSLEWWTKTNKTNKEAILLHHQANGSSGDVIESCKEL